MATKKVDLNKRCFFVLSGVSNELGESLALEMCRRFKSGSTAVLIGDSEKDLQFIRKEIQCLSNEIKVQCCNTADWKTTNGQAFRQILDSCLCNYELDYFDLALIVHNEGTGATQKLMEPQDSKAWLSYVQENLYSVVALNQEFLKSVRLTDVEKLVINITSSLLVRPYIYSSLMCSCKKARDMYFRAMSNEEVNNGIIVMNYAPGIMESHESVIDLNNNILELADLELDEKLLKLPRVKPLKSALKLINIVEKISFCSGHDVDYYDTYNL